MDKKKDAGREEMKQETEHSEKHPVAKARGEERERKEEVTQEDLKRKKVDGDPSREEDRP